MNEPGNLLNRCDTFWVIDPNFRTLKNNISTVVYFESYQFSP